MTQLKKDFTIAFQLSAVSRYSRDHMQKPESVLEHLGFCTYYGFLLAERIEKKLGRKIDRSSLFNKIASHDLDEAIVGDIPRTTKYFTKGIRNEFKKVETKIIEKMSDWLGINLMVPWHDAKEGLEGEMLRVIDIASVVYKNWTEIVMLRNRSFLRVAIETQSYLNNLKETDFSPALNHEIFELSALNESILREFGPLEEDLLFLRMTENYDD